jgi:hypothetical protein
MPWRPKVPSPTWRTFLRNYLPDIAAIDMFVVATATFRLLYTLIVVFTVAISVSMATTSHETSKAILRQAIME